MKLIKKRIKDSKYFNEKPSKQFKNAESQKDLCSTLYLVLFYHHREFKT